MGDANGRPGHGGGGYGGYNGGGFGGYGGNGGGGGGGAWSAVERPGGNTGYRYGAFEPQGYGYDGGGYGLQGPQNYANTPGLYERDMALRNQMSGPSYEVTGNDQSGYRYAGGVSPFDRGQPGGNLGRQSGTPYDQQGSQNAQNLWSQYQGAQPGQARDDLIRQMQGSDNGAAFNANMKNQGFVRTDSPGGNYSYSQPGGVSDQVRRMQDAQGLDRQGQQWPTQQWSSAGNQQGGGYGGFQPGNFATTYGQRRVGYGEPGGFHGQNGQPLQWNGYGQGGGWGGGQGGGWGGGQGGGQPK